MQLMIHRHPVEPYRPTSFLQSQKPPVLGEASFIEKAVVFSCTSFPIFTGLIFRCVETFQKAS